jgi:DNA-binding transcriptional MerR regulator
LFNKPSDLPVDQIKAMRSRGFDNNQIVQALQRNGYSSTQIFDALNQADLVSGAGLPSEPDSFMPSQPPPPPGMGMEQEPMQDYSGGSSGGVSNEEIEELVESIIEEKWDELSKDISKIVEWKNEVESKISKLEQRFDSLKSDFDKLHQAIIGKIGDYDKNILEVGAEIKAMEKVFSKVLPVFTENVNELNRITQTLKKKTA